MSTDRMGDLLADISQSLADLVSAAEKRAAGSELSAIEQALSDMAQALDTMKKAPIDARSLVDAIRSLKLEVTVSPTPIQVMPATMEPVFNVPPAAVSVAIEAFRPLVVKVNRSERTGLIETLEISQKR